MGWVWFGLRARAGYGCAYGMLNPKRVEASGARGSPLM